MAVAERKAQIDEFADFLASLHTQLWEGPYLIHTREGQLAAAKWFLDYLNRFRAWHRANTPAGAAGILSDVTPADVSELAYRLRVRSGTPTIDE
jgi:hypothetical protein